VNFSIDAGSWQAFNGATIRVLFRPMTRDNIVFTTCGLLLGLIVGTFLIGPRLAQKNGGSVESGAAASAPEAATEPATSPAASTASTPAQMPAMGGGNMQTMNAVREQLANLKATVEREPKNADALMQLGNMYMDAAKYQQAIEYYERSLTVRENPAVRTDLGICYKQAGQLDKSVDAFRKAAEDQPDQWQALFNEAIVLGEMKRFDEARAIATKLKQLRPNDPQIDKLTTALAGKS
jgi:predicted Zn-dependent protease